MPTRLLRWIATFLIVWMIIIVWMILFVILAIYQTAHAAEPTVTGGSVLFWRDGLLINPILRSTGSHITHAAVILDDYVYEAVPPRVRKVPLAEYIKEMVAKGQTRAMQRRDFKWFILQPKVPYTNAEVERMLAYAKSQVGRRYQLRGWWAGHEVRGVFCSQLVSNVLERGGRIKSASFRESPGSLYNRLQPTYEETP